MCQCPTRVGHQHNFDISNTCCKCPKTFYVFIIIMTVLDLLGDILGLRGVENKLFQSNGFSV